MDEKIREIIETYYPSMVDSESSWFQKNERRENKIVRKLKAGKEAFARIAQAAREYVVVDWTDERSCCYEFKVLLKRGQPILDDDRVLIKELHGKRVDARVFISVLTPCYYMFVEETCFDAKREKWTFETLSEEACGREIRDVLGMVAKMFDDMKYYRIRESAKELVPNMETELKGSGEVTVFDCLFTDMVDIQ